MSSSGGMSQLIKGIVIGVVLIMAIIGTMGLLDKDNVISGLIKNDNESQIQAQKPADITTPSITLNPNKTSTNPTQNDNTNIGDLNAEISEEIDSNNVENINNDATNIPTLEDEKTVEEATTKEIEYGIMELNAVNTDNKQALKVNYTVFSPDNTKVTESLNSTDASFRLPIGQYKVETTLTRRDSTTNKIIPVLTKNRYVIVRKNTTTKQSFELEPPATTGVLQVSAKMNDKTIRADYVIQDSNGEIIASRNNVSSSLFKLKTGTYKVTVNSGNNKDFRSVEVKPGESLQTVFNLKQDAQQGKLLVRVFDTRSNTPVRADIIITNQNGTEIQNLKSSVQTELSLVSGNYKISVIGPNGTSNRNIKVNPGQALNEVFRFDIANNNVDIDNNETQITENVSIKPIENQTPETTQAEISNKTTLQVIALDEQTRKPIRSNIYIQTPAGKHLAKETYVESASFSLDPGTYKITVRATNRKNNVKTIRVTKNNNVSQTFLLANPNKPASNTNNQQQVNTNKPAKTPKKIETGFLNVSMRAPNNQQVSKNSLNTHFIVATTAGKKIVELTSVNVGNFKLDVGSYIVTAIHKNKRRSQRVNVRANQNTRLAFNTSDFQAAMGILRSSIVDQSGTPIKGNLTVSNMAGQVIARANNVSTARFNLTPNRHRISINYQGLTGNEVVNISPNETTVQTFTIASSNSAPNNNQKNNSRDLKDLLREKIKKEIQRKF